MENAPVVLPIELTPAQVRPVAYRIFSKRHGLNLKSPALDVLAQFLGHHFGADWRSPLSEKSLDEIARRWKNEDRGIFVDGSALKEVLKDWMNAQASAGAETQHFEWRQHFKIVSATDQRRIIYDSTKHNFVPVPGTESFGAAKSLTNVFASRYEVLLDKLYRSEKFQPPGLANTAQILGNESHVITPIKNLLGKDKDTGFYLFGQLAKQTDGPWTLYDPTSSIPLEFGDYSSFFPGHYYTSGCFVIVHGQVYQGQFLVTMMGPPPVETRADAQEAYGRPDFYCKNSKRIERIDPQLEAVMLSEEEQMLQNRVVMLGADIFLDVTPIVDALRRVLKTLDTDPPLAIVFCGSFISQPFSPYLMQDGRSAAQVYRDGMNALAEVLAQCPNLTANSKLVFIPGPNDPWHSMSAVLPYKPLPSVFTGRVSHVASDAVWATNPCRLCYLSKEIVLFRSNCGAMLRENSLDTEVYRPRDSADDAQDDTAATAVEVTVMEDTDADDEEREADRAATRTMMEKPVPVAKHFTEHEASRAVLTTLLDQCHLSPFLLPVSPVMWEFDHVLSMAQWPTALAVFDVTSPRTKQQYEGCDIMNPGTFWYNGMANWLEYWPTEGTSKFMEMV